MSNQDSDEYDFFDMSEEDYARIDLEVASATLEHQQVNQLKSWMNEAAAPAIEIEFEQQPKSESNHRSVAIDSPYTQYRSRRKVLSVTDITSVSWCELQFDYGLRQMRNRKLDLRPNKFLSATGKELSVNNVVAAKNDVILTRGKFVHKDLEKHIRPVEVVIDVTTDEERWGLRLVNMLNCLDDLSHRSDHLCREMPVFGVVNNQPIVGIIDEIHYFPLLETRASSPDHMRVDRGTRSTPSNMKIKIEVDKEALNTLRTEKLTKFSPVSLSKPRPLTYKSTDTIYELGIASPTSAIPNNTIQYILQLTDSKTRRSSTLPREEDTRPSCLQLMMYHRLLSALITDFNFSSFWVAVDVDPLRPFSDAFQAQMLPIIETGDEESTKWPHCLEDLELLWKRRIADLGVSKVDRTMSLVYRTQSISRFKGDMESTDPELASAIQQSLISLTESPELRTFLEHAPEGAENTIPTDTPLEDKSGVRENHLVGLDDNIIGKKEVVMDDVYLDAHLSKTLSYWYGHRSPQGVSLEHTHRCFTCEYREGCEWREEKAEEVIRLYRERRKAT